MIYTTHNNHFEFGWGNNKFNFDDQTDNYWMKFGRAEYIPKSFRDECVRAARLIGQNAVEPIMICFSGGMDSEVVVRSFQEANISFEIVIMNLKYKNNYNTNHYDNIYAYNYVKKHNLSYRSITIDLEEYILNYLLNDAIKYKGNYLGLFIQKEIVRRFSKYHCVLGGGDIKLQRHRYNGRPNLPGLYLEEEMVSIAPMEVGYFENRGVSNRFYMHTPELMLACLIDPDISHWIYRVVSLVSKFGTINYYGMKSFVYTRHWPDIIDRPKYNGLEGIEFFKNSSIKNQLTELLAVADSYNQTEIIIDYQDLYDMLMPL